MARRDAHVADPLALRGKRVGVGPAGSGTEGIAWQVMRHFGLGEGDVRAQNLSLVDAQHALLAGSIDAAFVVAGMRTPAVDAMLATRDVELVALGDATRRGSALDGIRLDAPYLQVEVIPEHTYGAEPPAPVGTLGVTALRAARRQSRKGRVEAYYEEVQRLAVRLREALDADARSDVANALRAVRSRAMDGLASEELDANESFTILLAYIDGLLADARNAPGPTG